MGWKRLVRTKCIVRKRRTARSGKQISSAGNGCRELPERQPRECTQPTTNRSTSTTRVGRSGFAPNAADAPQDQWTWEETVQGPQLKALADIGRCSRKP
eukprot:734766-Heterocapsa_arctica.AAC.1